MATYVLVGGAWVGAWIWQPVTRRLGHLHDHNIYPATLTGLGDRVHLARPEVDLDTHITDVVKLIEFEDLSDVILVGHSYAGIVVTGVADRIAERIGTLVFCDSAPLGDGQTLLGMSPPDAQTQTRRTVDESGDHWRWPFPPLDELARSASLTGLGEPELALMRRKAVAHPFGTYTQPLRLTRSGPPSYRRVMILCEDGQRLMQVVRASLAAGEPYFSACAGDDWEYRELNTGHWPMLSMPAELAATLDDLSATSPPA